jgi:hypothetical protein
VELQLRLQGKYGELTHFAVPGLISEGELSEKNIYISSMKKPDAEKFSDMNIE